MDVIPVKKSTGEVLTAGVGNNYGRGRQPDPVPVRSGVRVTVRFLADDLQTRVTLAPAAGALTVASLPAAGDTFTIGALTYTVVAALTGAANQVLRGADATAFAANLAAAISAGSTNGQAAGTTYGMGTTANPVASASASSGVVVLVARYADASGNAVATTTTSLHAVFGAPTLTGGEVLKFDIKPDTLFDADFTIPTPAFTAPLDPATGDYTATLNTNVAAAIVLLDPNNADGAHPNEPEPTSKLLMAQLSWGVAGAVPARSDRWALVLSNVVRHDGEGVPPLNPPALTQAMVRAAVAAVTPYQTTATDGGESLPAGVRAVSIAVALEADLDLTLPPAASYPRGATIEFSDPHKCAVLGNVRLFPAYGGNINDTLDGLSTNQTIFGPADPAGKRVVITSDGVNQWLSQPQGAAIGGAPTFEIYDVTNAQRLAGVRGDDVTPLVPGNAVRVTDQGGRIEQYLGPLAGEAGAGCKISGSGPVDGNYSLEATIGVYSQLDTYNHSQILGGPGGWNLDGGQGTIYSSYGPYPWSEGYPWYSVTDDPNLPPPPTVTRNDIVADENWNVIENTVNLLVAHGGDGSTMTVNGAFVATNGTFTDVGWVKPTAVSFTWDNYGSALTFNTVAAGGVYYPWAIVALADEGPISGTFALPPLRDRASNVRISE